MKQRSHLISKSKSIREVVDRNDYMWDVFIDLRYTFDFGDIVI